MRLVANEKFEMVHINFNLVITALVTMLKESYVDGTLIIETDRFSSRKELNDCVQNVYHQYN